MASPNKNPEYQAKLPRYGHDLSFDFGFTASTGMLLPVLYDIVNPGEKVNCSVNIFTQLQVPMAVPAQIEMEQVVDFFFVPFPMLYQPFESMIYQTNDYLSSANSNMQILSRSMSENLPYFCLYDAVTTPTVPAVSSIVTRLRNNLGFYNWYDVYNGLPNRNCFEAVGMQAYRLLDMCGFNADAIVKPQTDVASGRTYQPMTDFNPNVFPYQLLAYQCIYQYFYRIDQWERFENRYFNWDKYSVSSSYGTSSLTDYYQLGLLQLHYRPKYLDYFTSVKPSPYLQGRNMLLDSNSYDNSANILVNFEHWLSDYPLVIKSSTITGSALPASQSTQVAQTNWTGSSYSSQSLVGSQQLRNLRAADKFLQITARAANRYDDQVLAHLGYTVPNDVKHNIKYLGTQRAPFKINQVVSTEGSTLGDRAGYALGSVSGKGIVYTAPCHGVLMAIYSTMVKPRYIAGFDRANVIRNIHDFWQPEYDNLGMQPIFDYELQRMVIEPTKAAKIAGWQWRYSEKKRKYSRVSSAFRKYVQYYIDSNNALNNDGTTVNPLSSYFNIQYPLSDNIGWGSFSTHDKTISNDYIKKETSGAFSNNFLDTFDWLSVLVPPTQLNNVLAMPYNEYWNYLEYAKNPAAIYQTDPFIVDMKINYKKVSPMSVHSMPEINE